MVSYDIRYGPREQVADGVDGFVVPEGDEAALADRVIELLRSPELVQRMSAAAREKVARYGPAEFVERWAQVHPAAVELEPRPHADRGGRLRADAGCAGGAGRARTCAASCACEGRGNARRRPRLRLDAVHDERRGRSSCRWRSSARTRRFRVDGDRSRSTAALPAEGVARLRLRLTWNNSAWETEIAQPHDGVEVSFGPGGVVQLAR